MGNQQFKCPIEATPGTGILTCVLSCPKGYQLKPVDGAQACVSTVDPEVFVHLTPLPMVIRPMNDESAFSISSLSPGDAKTRYTNALNTFKDEMALADSKINHEVAVKSATKTLLDAPLGDATDAAKAEYIALTSDPKAASFQIEQAARLNAATVTSKFVDQFQFLNNQSKQQQSTLDLIRSVKDNILSVKDDMQYSVSTFEKQVKDIQNQISINHRKQKETTDYGQWLDAVLNFAIIAALLFAIVMIGRKLFANSTPAIRAAVAPPPVAGGAFRVMKTKTGGPPRRAPASPHTMSVLKTIGGAFAAE